MRTDKALLQLDGKPLIVHALAILRKAAVDAAIAGSRSDLSPYGRVIEDAGRGPLDGICAALESMSAGYAIFLSVDAPFLPSSLVSSLLKFAQRTDDAAITLASVSGFPQTFPVVLHHSLLRALQSELEAGHGGCYAAFRAATQSRSKPLRILAAEHLLQAGQIDDPRGLPASDWFLNVNSPADLAYAEKLLPLLDRVS